MNLKFNHYFFLLLLILLIGCGGSSTSTNTSTNSVNKLLIGHFGGIDFSKDNNNSEWEKQDGYTVTWSPTNKYIAGESNGNGVWYNNNLQDTTNTYVYIQSLGEVSLDSVSTINTTAWVAFGSPIASLKVSHTYVVKTRDGYAKFKVLSVDLISSNWNFVAEYVYSATTSF